MLQDLTRFPGQVIATVAGKVVDPISLKSLISVIEMVRQEANGDDSAVTVETFLFCLAGVVGA